MMKTILAATVALTLTGLAPASFASADAAVVTKRVVTHHGPFGHGCRKVVRTVRSHGRTVRTVRRVCR